MYLFFASSRNSFVALTQQLEKATSMSCPRAECYILLEENSTFRHVELVDIVDRVRLRLCGTYLVSVATLVQSAATASAARINL